MFAPGALTTRNPLVCARQEGPQLPLRPYTSCYRVSTSTKGEKQWRKQRLRFESTGKGEAGIPSLRERPDDLTASAPEDGSLLETEKDLIRKTEIPAKKHIPNKTVCWRRII